MQILVSPRYIPSLAEKDSEMTKVENVRASPDVLREAAFSSRFFR